jgi:hypothetical protein
MKVGVVNDSVKALFQKVGTTLTQEWSAKAGDTGKAVISAYKK